MLYSAVYFGATSKSTNKSLVSPESLFQVLFRSVYNLNKLKHNLLNCTFQHLTVPNIIGRNENKCYIQPFISVQRVRAPTRVWYHQKACFKYFSDQFTKKKYHLTHRPKIIAEDDPDLWFSDSFGLSQAMALHCIVTKMYLMIVYHWGHWAI